ncbi:MAG: TPM domain-containing protein [Casimicrobiaceae bacterium]
MSGADSGALRPCGSARLEGWARSARVVVLVLLALVCAWAYAQDASRDGLAPIPPLASRVTDTANLLPPGDRAALEGRLAAFEQKTGGQLAVLIVPTAQPETIEQYALRVAEAWKIGRAGQDNGIVIILAMQERKVRIEVGRGWEGALPDVEAKRIIREVMAPFFKQNQFAQGLSAAVDKIELAVAREGQPADGAWQKSHQADAMEAVAEQVNEMLPFALGAALIGSFFLPPIMIGGGTAVGTYLLTSSIQTAAVFGVFALILASILRGIFGSFGQRPVGGRRIYRDRGGVVGPWISTGSTGGWSYGGGASGDSGWSGGGGDFGGGGASGDW